ncbi:TolB family protein [Kribbella sp. NPDC058693]|uniref:TolB family protein n=1 Tax=Kribbella sp. NPDC058693 TaxID=3346602 RepID=UPI003647F831
MTLLHTIKDRRPIRTALAVLAVAAVPVGAVAVPAAADGDRHQGTIGLVSVGAAGGGGNAGLFPGTEKGVGVSGDGRYVVFSSYATDLVPNDTNGQRDVFVRDTKTGRTTLASVGVGGIQGNQESSQGSISADGRFVAFNSDASNLLPGDTNNSPDVFVRDLRTGRTTLVSVGRSGQADQGAHQPEISADGLHVVFTSASTNLVAGDTNQTADVFVRDLDRARTERVSLTAGGLQSTHSSSDPAISANGRFVAFASNTEVAVRDRDTNRTRVVSRGVTVDPRSDSLEAGKPSISNDGRFVVFTVIGWLPGMDPVPNVWLRDLRTDRLELVSVDHLGQPALAIGAGFRTDISADGRYVTYGSTARLTRTDEGEISDVFRLDRRTRSLLWITSGQDQTQVNGRNGSHGPAISDDGQHVAFDSDATTLAPGGGTSGYDTYLWSSAHIR